MPDSKKPVDAAADPLPPTHPVPARRRLLRGSLAAGPVVMTLVSRPVLGGGGGGGGQGGGFGLCTTPSGFVSASGSTAGRGVTCEGHTYEYWKKASSSQWPSPYKPSTKFNDVFKTPTYAPYYGKTLEDVLGLGSSPPNNVARACVAALLNAQDGLTPPLSVSAVKDIWSEYITKGYYSPQSGAHWSPDEIIAYLATTTPV